MAWKDVNIITWIVGFIATLFGLLLGLLRYIWNGHLKEVNKTVNGLSQRVSTNDDRLDYLEKDVPLKLMQLDSGLKKFAKDEFTPVGEFRAAIKEIKGTSLARYKELREDNKITREDSKEIKGMITQMRSDIIAHQAQELAVAKRRIQELIDGGRRGGE